MTQTHIFKVGELARAMKDVMEAEFPFVWVRGQAANVARPGSGHIYFTLRDEEASLNVVWFRGAQRAGASVGGERIDPRTGEVLSEPAGAGLADGAEMLCAGRLTVYPPRGSCQLVAEFVQNVGAGRLHLEFEALKRELSGLGYFAEERKMAPPRHPERVAVVTAPSGAAIRDFVRIGRERGHGCQVRVYPTLVQGEAAPAMIAAALRRACAADWAQVVVLIRGGGSLEDLWAFNTREVAQAIHDADIPVVSGVGHEVDVTIADLVADVRAATPSHAAQILWPERAVLAQRLDDLELAASRAFERRLAALETALGALERGLAWLSPDRRLARLEEGFTAAVSRLSLAGELFLRGREERFGGLDRRLDAAWSGLADARDRALERAEIRLAGLDPMAPLSRGYSLARVERTGRFLRAASEVVEGDKLDVILYEGRVRAEVTQREGLRRPKGGSPPLESPSGAEPI